MQAQLEHPIDGSFKTSKTYISAVLEMATTIQRIYVATPMFPGQLSNKHSGNAVTSNRKEPEYVLGSYTRKQRNSNRYTHAFGVGQHEETSGITGRCLRMLKIKDGGH